MNTRILVAVVVPMFVCQQVYAQDEPEAEATELEGTWELVSYVIRGRQIEFGGRRWRFEGNRYYTRNDSLTDWFLASAFSVDPSAMPAKFDFVPPTWPGIYDLDDDSLTICFGFGGVRPDRFESSEDYPTRISVHRRVEEDDE